MAAAVIAADGEDVQVDVSAIEKALSDLWRVESGKDGEQAVVRAALWNVVAHTTTPELQAKASETLGRAAAEVPQRTIVIRSQVAAEPELASWIGANCHLFDGGKQVCSEEIVIVGGGDRIHRVPPLVNALLIPDMPVALWWLGDLPAEHEGYVQALLEPADRLIVDSVHFDDPSDLALLSRVAEETTTAPADLNWGRLEEWRAATASIFDPPSMRSRLRAIRRIRIIAGTAEEDFFGHQVESLFFAAWLSAQAGHRVDREGRAEGESGAIGYDFERKQSAEIGSLAFVEIMFDDGSCASISRDRERGVLKSNVDGVESTPASVTRALPRELHALIVRQLKRPEGDPVLLKVLPLATRMAKRLK